MTDSLRTTSIAEKTDIREVNRRFYDGLWSGTRLVQPQRFNTWPLVSELAAACPQRLEIGPGMRPRLPLENTHFADISEPALQALSAHGGHAESASITSLPYADQSFDLVCALDIIEHVEDDESAMSELARVAAPGACVLISTPLHPAYWSTFDEIVGHYRRYVPAELIDLLDRNGLKIEQSAIFGMKPKSTRLSSLGLWFLKRDRAVALKVYNHILMPLGLRLQKPLDLVPGLPVTDGVDEILLVCRRQT